MRLNERTRMVGWQFEHRRFSPEYFFPIGKLRFVNLTLEPIAMPERIVGILDGQFRKRRRPPMNKGLVKSRQLSLKNAHGPTVGYDVMHCNQQDVLFGLQPEQAS